MYFTCAGLKIENRRFSFVHKIYPCCHQLIFKSIQVQFFKDLGLWFLPVGITKEEKLCSTPDKMSAYAASNGESLLDKCCVTGNYWKA